jgi:ankyrin repeat protein
LWLIVIAHHSFHRLHLAVGQSEERLDSGHLEVVKLLLEKGAGFTAPNSDGWTPLNANLSQSTHHSGMDIV